MYVIRGAHKSRRSFAYTRTTTLAAAGAAAFYTCRVIRVGRGRGRARQRAPTALVKHIIAPAPSSPFLAADAAAEAPMPFPFQPRVPGSADAVVYVIC